MPTLKKQEKSERLEARITRDQKELFKRAAQIQGRSLTDFLVQAASDAANRVVQEEHILNLAREDQEALVNALLNPPKPNARLKAAVEDYRKTVRQ
ncbi:MAG: DUF1778 domain-containing protein [Candidatus Omnitrophica bacterium]|nr:DUF1778 domain-containing protein [Candidatus Omnitrophota bacterium]MCA9415198.1 DUF1778 domain-containing protein [Candidatus Omnitrophota bacterium]MCA9443612.1 DUF1778 domain-containing protein [Candidatus Omnitrophota bacterium]MCA9446755.1 DUF1778 domain-containing protein [Candidatus Omnitrophota bacterium]MCB9770719.1 DUF1778 domain-containing protein [Candidatus Omnitrophota bacterium]